MDDGTRNEMNDQSQGQDAECRGRWTGLDGTTNQHTDTDTDADTYVDADTHCQSTDRYLRKRLGAAGSFGCVLEWLAPA